MSDDWYCRKCGPIKAESVGGSGTKHYCCLCGYYTVHASTPDHVITLQSTIATLQANEKRLSAFVDEVDRIINEASYTGDDRDLKISCRLFELRNPPDLFKPPQEPTP